MFLTNRHHATLHHSILPNETANIIKQNWNQFLLVVKAATLISKYQNFIHKF